MQEAHRKGMPALLQGFKRSMEVADVVTSELIAGQEEKKAYLRML